MMDKYYVGTVIDRGDMCDCFAFHYSLSFDTLEEAKAWADSAESHGGKTIFRCTDNVITAILNDNFGWQPIEGQS